MNKSELVSIYVAFTDVSGGKRRPVLITKHSENILHFYRLTSKYDNKSAKIKMQYYPLKDWREAGLIKPSWIDIGQELKARKDDLSSIRHIGHLTERDINGLTLFVEKFKLAQYKK